MLCSRVASQLYVQRTLAAMNVQPYLAAPAAEVAGVLE
jgi:hypothetical protein